MALAALAMSQQGGSQNPLPGMATIPAGTFEMGDHHGFVDPQHPSDEVPLYKVRQFACRSRRHCRRCLVSVQATAVALGQFAALDPVNVGVARVPGRQRKLR